MLKVKLPDGSVREYSHPVRAIDVAQEIGPRLAKATLAAEVDGQVVGHGQPLAGRRRCVAQATDAQRPRGIADYAPFLRTSWPGP